jgi:NADPH:quinone reductase-like Zn-dependent oxidoreductase
VNVFGEPGLANLRIMHNVKEPDMSDLDILVRVKVAGVNPIDSFIISGALPKIIPLPIISGALPKIIPLPNHIPVT